MIDRRIKVAYALLTGCALLQMAMPALGLLLTFLTLGLAALVPTVWIYVTLAIPGFLLWKCGRHWSLSAAVGTLPIMLVGFVPAMIAHPQADFLATELTKDDYRLPMADKPTAVQLYDKSDQVRVPNYDLVDYARCNEFCQHLLLSGQVENVTVQANLYGSIAQNSKKRVAVTTYVVEHLPRCPLAFGRQSSLLPSTIRASVQGKCIVAKRDVAMTNGIRLWQKEFDRQAVPEMALVSTRHVRRLFVTEVKNGVQEPLLRQTEVKLGIVTAPVALMTYAGLLTTVNGVALVQNAKTYHAYSLPDILSDLGISVTAAEPESNLKSLSRLIRMADDPLDPNNAMISTILAKPGSEPFGSELTEALGTWTKHQWFGDKTPGKDELALFQAMLVDFRIHGLSQTNSYFQRTKWRGNEQDLERLLDPILQRLTASSLRDDRGQAWLASLIANQSDAFVSRNGDRILAALSNGVYTSSSPLLKIAAKLGRRGVPAIVVGISSPIETIREDADRAACLAQKDMAADLVPALKAAISNEKRNAKVLVLALASLDGKESARVAVSAKEPKMRTGLERWLDQNISYDGTVTCPETG